MKRRKERIGDHQALFNNSQKPSMCECQHTCGSQWTELTFCHGLWESENRSCRASDFAPGVFSPVLPLWNKPPFRYLGGRGRRVRSSRWASARQPTQDQPRLCTGDILVGVDLLFYFCGVCLGCSFQKDKQLDPSSCLPIPLHLCVFILFCF